MINYYYMYQQFDWILFYLRNKILAEAEPEMFQFLQFNLSQATFYLECCLYAFL